jgi:small subunit ribosomal protein S20
MVKSRVRSSARRFLQLVESRAVEEATSQYRNVSSLLDRAASKGVIARNAAARTKRRLHRRLAGLGKAS